MFLRFITFSSYVLRSFAFSGAEFYTNYMLYLQKRFRPAGMMWTDQQMKLATEIAENIDKIKLSDLMDESTQEKLIAAINIRDFGKIEKILRSIEVESLTPWYIPILRIGIGLALNYCTPEIIRESCANLLGPTVM